MYSNEEVFISYSWDSKEHINNVLELSNKLRSEGIDAIIDQYEESPPEGWPCWMDKKIRNSKYILLICTENYYKRSTGEEETGIGNGVKWEGHLIFQHLYNAGANNTKFIPVIFNDDNKQYIPTPLQGSTIYCLNDEDGYNNLYYRLIEQPKIVKPELGKKRPLPEKPVKTNPAMFITSPINIDLWNEAKWNSTIYAYDFYSPPVLLFGFTNEEPAIKIFKEWQERYGKNDKYEEIRISIIEGDIYGEDPGYTVHINTDAEHKMKQLEKMDIGFNSKNDLLMTIGRFNRMNPITMPSENLERFKNEYRRYKSYFIAPCIYYDDGREPKPFYEYKILKGKILFKTVDEITEHDIDRVILKEKV